MINLTKRNASDVGVQPAYVKGLEKHGICYFTWPENNAVGGQCESCHTIVWVDPRLDPILNETKPSSVPDSGPDYRNYFIQKIARFLSSLPKCPNCSSPIHDKFINNTSYPRFPDGSVFDNKDGAIELRNVDSEEIKVWWLER